MTSGTQSLQSVLATTAARIRTLFLQEIVANTKERQRENLSSVLLLSSQPAPRKSAVPYPVV